MDTQDAIGKLLDAKQQRDAIHVAVAPVVALRTCAPGQHIGLTNGKADPLAEKTIGIADPFLKAPVKSGDRFFMFLYPNTVTGLRHQWRHPAFDGAAEESERWLREFAADNCSFYDDSRTPEQCYEELLRMAEEGDFCFSGQPDELYDPAGQMKIWHHIEIVRGAPFDHRHKESASFRCSC